MKNNELLEILGEIDSIVRDDFAERRIGFESYDAITKKLAHLNRMIKGQPIKPRNKFPEVSDRIT